MKIWRLALATIIALIATLGMVIPSHAMTVTPKEANPRIEATANPDSTPTISNGTLHVYRNLLSPGDSLYIWEANTPYATPPATSFSDTFIWRLMASDGVTVLGTTTGYSFQDGGYGYNVFSMYFPSSAGLIWNPPGGYTLKLSGNPAQFTTVTSYIYNVPSSAYTSLTTQSDNQSALAAQIISIASDLNNRWALTTVLLTDSSGTHIVLSYTGSTVFRGAILGVQGMAPLAFDVAFSDINAPDRTWSDNYSNTLNNQWAGTWVADAIAGGAGLFVLNWDLSSMILLLIACVVVYFCELSLTGDHWQGLIDVTLVLCVFSRLGLFGIGYLGLLSAVAIIYIGMRLFNQIPR